MRCVSRGKCAVVSVLAGLFFLLLGIDAAPAVAATCASLTTLRLPDTAITTAQLVLTGKFAVPGGPVFDNLPAFCRVAATLTPTSDSNIKIEVWMPYSVGTEDTWEPATPELGVLSSGAPWPSF